LSNSQKPQLSRIEISKEAFNYSIGHFTIFSATHRENLHGHNFQMQCFVTAELGDSGLLFDYAILKQIIRGLCDEIDEQVILPANSPYLKIAKEKDYIVATFNGERLPFLERDVTILPISNTTIEAFSHYFLEKLVHHPELINRGIRAMSVKVSSSPGQLAVADWEKI